MLADARHDTGKGTQATDLEPKLRSDVKVAYVLRVGSESMAELRLEDQKPDRRVAHSHMEAIRVSRATSEIRSRTGKAAKDFRPPF